MRKLLLLAILGIVFLNCAEEELKECNCYLVTYEDGVEIKRIPYEDGCEEPQYDYYHKSWLYNSWRVIKIKEPSSFYSQYIECD
jgi:hypothetical protein